jgi:adenylate kinase family enzyme
LTLPSLRSWPLRFDKDDRIERIVVVGCIGAGKSTLSRRLGTILDLEVIHLDRLWWSDGTYTITGPSTVRSRTLSPNAFRELQRDLVSGEQWIIDGDAKALEIRLARADTIIFLDLPILLCAWRVLRRHGTPRPDYPDGVRESWRWTATLIRWILWWYPRQRRAEIEAAIAAYGAHAGCVRLNSQSEVDAFVESIPRP